MILLGLSGKKRSGKSTVANHLKTRYNFVEISFAYPLKEYIGRGVFGLNDDQLYGSEEVREAVDPRWGLSPRAILQKVGTDLLRDGLDEDIWVKVAANKINEICAKNPNARIVVSDCRFPNEIETLRKLGGYGVRVTRIGQVSRDTHSSETSLDTFHFDYHIQGEDGSIQSVYDSTDKLITTLLLRGIK